MPMRLMACPSCHCHVKVGAPRCPFCEHELPREASPRPALPASGKSLSRAAILFASASTVGACGSSSTEPSPVVFYGPAPIVQNEAGTDGGTTDAAPDASDAASTVVFYGPAPIQDGGDAGD